MLLNKVKDFINSKKYTNHPSLGPSMSVFNFLGIWHCDFPSLNFAHLIIMRILRINYLIITMCMYIEVWFIRDDLQQVLFNLSLTFLCTVTVWKMISLTFWRTVYEECVREISRWECKDLKDSNNLLFITDYIRYSRIITVMYCVVSSATGIFLGSSPLVKYIISSKEYKAALINGSEPYPQVISVWVPFDKNSPLGYTAISFYSIAVHTFGATFIFAYDSMSMAMMIFFAGQMKILRDKCGRIFGSAEQRLSDREVADRIIECHKRHEFLFKYARKLDTLTSPIMFCYVLICSCTICASGIQLIQGSSDFGSVMWVTEYTIALTIQIFIYCWHSNEVFILSESVYNGVYESDWWRPQFQKFGRQVILLSGKLHTSFVFTAGPYTSLSVTTFVSLMKGAYSFYALFKRS